MDQDTLPYPSRPLPEAHVDVLATIATLFDASPVPVDRARVLHVGCEDGAHLVPMAERLAETRFVGVTDEAGVEAFSHRWAPLELSNLEVVTHEAFADDDTDGHDFDYVIAHRRLAPGALQGLGKHLSPHGVLYASFRCLPAADELERIAGLVRTQTAADATDRQRVTRAREVIGWLGGALDPELYGLRIRACERALSMDDATLLRDVLDAADPARWFTDVVAEADEAGLTYLGEADFPGMIGTRLAAGAQRALERAPAGFLAQQQLQDVLGQRSLRHALFVRADVAVERAIPWERAAELWVAAPVRRVGRDGERVRFQGLAGLTASDDPVLQTALDVLGEHWPAGLRFQDWVLLASERSGCSGLVLRGMLGRQLLEYYGSGVVRLEPRDLGAPTKVDPYPLTPRGVQRSVALGLHPTGLRHRSHALPAIPRTLVPLLDGRHDVRSLAAELSDLRRHGHLKFEGAPERAVQIALAGMAERGLLVR